MPPIVASILTWGLVGYLFRRDLRARPNVTAALWIPFLWFFFIGTRTFTQWTQAFGFDSGGTTYEEGTPLDAAVFFGLIVAGIAVLRRRQVSLAVFAQYNRWIMIFLVYSLISCVWSDFSFVAFKRWIKIIGHPVMVMVLLTEPDPVEAITQMMKRFAYIAFPVSILFIKYYPWLGRTFDPFVGLPTNIGIALDKNMLGSVCMICCVFLIWYHLKVSRRPRSRERRAELFWNAVVLGFIFWVLYLAHSSTSLVSMLVAIGIIVFLGLKSVRKERLTFYLITAVVVLGVAQWAFDVYGMALGILGKDPTLTDRTKVWGDVLKISINPLIGTGFESFWLGERREAMWQIYWWHPIQAHNGYLEMYLNIGLVGLFFMVMTMIQAYQNAGRMLMAGVDFARFRVGFVAAFVLYNWTEAAYKALHPVFFIFFLVALDYPTAEPAKVENSEPMVDTPLSADAV